VFNENKKFSQGAKINGLLHCHLPEGPTCLYRLTSLVLSKKIRNHGRATSHYPELILNNFSTRMGHRVGRMFASVFPQKPEFQGRRVVGAPLSTPLWTSCFFSIDPAFLHRRVQGVLPASPRHHALWGTFSSTVYIPSLNASEHRGRSQAGLLSRRPASRLAPTIFHCLGDSGVAAITPLDRPWACYPITAPYLILNVFCISLMFTEPQGAHTVSTNRPIHHYSGQTNLSVGIEAVSS